MRKQRLLSKPEAVALARLQRMTARLAGALETVSFGHPTFAIGGKAFAVLDRYSGEECLWVRVDPLERARLLAGDGWRESPYDPRRLALICPLTAIDWRRIGRQVRSSYQLAALAAPRRRR